MQYESILLEILSRVKQLETDMTTLQKKTDALEARLFSVEHYDESPKESTEEMVEEQMPDGSGLYQKMTGEMIALCYRYGKEVHNGASAKELADKLYEETGMNRASAIMYLYAVRALLDGTVFKRAISSKALQQYLNNIQEEYGDEGLRTALKAVRSHVAYRRGCGHLVDSIDKLCLRYEEYLQQ